jgi:hypothetical protein
MSAILSTVKELKELNEELKTLRLRIKESNIRKKECENDVLVYLDENQQPGVKYGNFIILAETKNRRTRKKKAEKEEDGRAVLDRYGVENSDTVYKELMESMKGTMSEVSMLKTKVAKN